MKAEDWIHYLDLKPHPEGGYFHECHRSKGLIAKENLTSEHQDSRSYYTSIYFLLNGNQVSNFHRILSDEIWTFHIGSSLEIHVIEPSGKYSILKLGLSAENNEMPQIMVPARSWFGACLHNSEYYTLASCIVAPGFHFDDFELGRRDVLIQKYPEYAAIIEKLTPALYS